MRLLVDESTGKRLADMLAGAKHDVIFAGDIMPAASDEAVLARAESEGRILISDDKDFGELIVRRRKPAPGFILLRTASTDPEERFGILTKTMRELDVEGKLVVVKDGRIRIRKL
ncbi:DUF5615 family PIN-like protein [Candidatus Woesearchaeota archaeon]|nr:DUF5615 family PIN-like protein [Candidatus Woesearchaeota archaeon]